MKHPRVWLLAATARWLGVPEEWLRLEAEAGRVPHLRIGERILFNPDKVEQELLRRMRGGGPRKRPASRADTGTGPSRGAKKEVDE